MTENKLKIYSTDLSTELEIPLAASKVVGGFPSPAEGYIEGSIDLNKKLIRHPATTFYAHVIGDSMCGRGIEDGDLIVIDKSLEPADGDIVVCFINGDFTMKTFRVKTVKGVRKVWLEPANENFPIIEIAPDEDFSVWGVVTYNIKKHR